jgi:hypothetical protein
MSLIGFLIPTNQTLRRLQLSEYKPKDVFGRPFPLEHAIQCVGAGWVELIRECYALCVEYKVDIHQVKEKFGGLRFYTGAVDRDTAKEFFDKIEAVCHRSYGTCENCGQPGELDNNRRWVKTLCSNCTEVNRIDQGHELYHLLSPEAAKQWTEDIKSGKVHRTIKEFVERLRAAISSPEEDAVE